jgi:SAM-dependent methyltransferase
MKTRRFRFAELHYKEDDSDMRRKLHYWRYFGERTGRILDIGCSVGDFIVHDPERIEGVDIDTEAIQRCQKRGFRAEQADLNAGLPHQDESFENIHCWHVIEHLDDALTFMSEIYRVLKNGGLLVLATPNFASAYRAFYDDPTHISPLTRESLRRIALNAGFKEESLSIKYELRPVGMGRLYSRGIISLSMGLFLENLAYDMGLGKLRGSIVLTAVK